MARTEVFMDKDELVIRVCNEDLALIGFQVDSILDIVLLTDDHSLRVRVPPKLQLPDDLEPMRVQKNPPAAAK